MPTRKAADIMTRSVVTLSPDMDVYGALQRLLKKKISGAPVVDLDGHLVGVLSEKDCLKVLTGEALDGLPEGKVSDYMTRSVQSHPDDQHLRHRGPLPSGALSALARRGSGRARGRASQSEGCAQGDRVHP